MKKKIKKISNTILNNKKKLKKIYLLSMVFKKYRSKWVKKVQMKKKIDVNYVNKTNIYSLKIKKK